MSSLLSLFSPGPSPLRLRIVLPLLLGLAGLASAALPVFANEHGGEASDHGGGAAEHGEKKKEPPQTEPTLPGLKQVQLKKTMQPQPKPVALDGAKGVELFCGGVAASAASTRLAWQEDRIKSLQAQLVIKIVELDAKEAEVRAWVDKREELLARANETLIAIYAKMKPEAAAAQLAAMDDDSAAAVLLKLKPATASAVMTEMDPTRAARLGDLLSGASPKSDEKKS